MVLESVLAEQKDYPENCQIKQEYFGLICLKKGYAKYCCCCKKKELETEEMKEKSKTLVACFDIFQQR